MVVLKFSEPDNRQASCKALDSRLFAGTPVITGILDQIQGKAEPAWPSRPATNIDIMMSKSEMPVNTGIFKVPNRQAFAPK